MSSFWHGNFVYDNFILLCVEIQFSHHCLLKRPTSCGRQPLWWPAPPGSHIVLPSSWVWAWTSLYKVCTLWLAPEYNMIKVWESLLRSGYKGLCLSLNTPALWVTHSDRASNYSRSRRPPSASSQWGAEASVGPTASWNSILPTGFFLELHPSWTLR